MEKRCALVHKLLKTETNLNQRLLFSESVLAVVKGIFQAPNTMEKMFTRLLEVSFSTIPIIYAPAGSNKDFVLQQ